MTRKARIRLWASRHRRAIAALFAAAAVGFGLAALRPATASGVPVLAAARDLPGGAPLRPQDLRTVALPPAAVPDGALRAGAIGRTLAAPVRRGEPITDARLLGPGLLQGSAPHLVATPIRIADAGTARLLRPGDLIDVLTTAPPDPSPDPADALPPDTAPSEPPGIAPSRPATAPLKPPGMVPTEPPGTAPSRPAATSPKPLDVVPAGPPGAAQAGSTPNDDRTAAGYLIDVHAANDHATNVHPVSTHSPDARSPHTAIAHPPCAGRSGIPIGIRTAGDGAPAGRWRCAHRGGSGSGHAPVFAGARGTQKAGRSRIPQALTDSPGRSRDPGTGRVRVVAAGVRVVAVPREPAGSLEQGALVVLATDRGQATALAGATGRLSVVLTSPPA
ncbi:SAF domain-containing protein [Actinomadura craniellae]|uniref:SAF domain-containing protein n=1 Tax=Actinomadura craniellae TaxID=2231787 RepID=UPI0018F11102|nr:SAF domain-containing protein [Actinomadura craniellae]